MSRAEARHTGSCHCGAVPDSYGVNVFCLDDFEPEGIPVRAADGKGMT